jgi:hypothetical protein
MTINLSINIMRNVHAFLEEVLFSMIVLRKNTGQEKRRYLF